MKIHFIGIGGIGVSALAKYYLSQGAKISGSDLSANWRIVFNNKERKKIKFYSGHKENNLPKNADLVIYSAAVPKNNPELKRARRLKIPCFSCAEALGELTKKFHTIAISGMHGKSTTTAMVASILVEAGLNPTVIIGSKFKKFGNSNFRLGRPPDNSRVNFRENPRFNPRKSAVLVIEADEFNASFLNYWPKIIVLNNIEEEHLDYYKNLEHILKTFKEYVGHLPEGGVLIANKDDKNIQKILNPKFKIRNPKPRSRCFASLRGRQILNSPEGSRQGGTYGAGKFQIPKTLFYSLKQKEVKYLKKILKVPGKHNISNALAALSIARILNIKDEISFKALSEFQGIWRRFEYKGKINGATIYDDYGHHPTEIKATLAAAKEILPKTGRLFLVFQPHQHHRTLVLFNQFQKAFDLADKIVLLDIYDVAGREDESIKRQVNSLLLAESLRNRKKDAVYLPSFEKAAGFLKHNLRKNDLAIIMGAGDIYKLTQLLFIK